MNPTEELKAVVYSIDQLSTLTALLDAGADINAQTVDGRTVLMVAAWYRNSEWCAELLERGANLQVWNYDRRTAWDYLYPLYGTAFYSLFLQYGADVNQYNPQGCTALHYACRSNDDPLIRLLLTEGADPRLPCLDEYHRGETAYDLGSFWDTPEGCRARVRWDTISIQEVFIVASELGIVPVPSYLW